MINMCLLFSLYFISDDRKTGLNNVGKYWLSEEFLVESFTFVSVKNVFKCNIAFSVNSVEMSMGRCGVELGVGTSVEMWTGRVFSVESKWCGTSVKI